MRKERKPQLTPRMQGAIRELEGMILDRYPGTRFRVGPGQDDPAAVHLTAVVDTDDTEEVVDLVIDRMMELQIQEELPLFVIPIRSPARVAADLGAEPERGRSRLSRMIPVAGESRPPGR